MLKLYYHPLSPIARRVWWALLEKEIPFNPVIVDLRGKQFEPNFLAISPFHHVPVLVHDDVHLIESLAILDYLDHQFPQNSLSPIAPAGLAKMRMVQMVVTNEVITQLVAIVNAENQSLSTEKKDHLETCFRFLDEQLGEGDYFGGDRLNLADIITGSTVPLFSRLGISLQTYESLSRWQARIMERPSWQQTNPNDDDFQQWKRWIQLQVKRRQRQRTRA
ncbi:glutathione S-transferase family protein [Leptolyngbya sp. BC1307]|uniref:glutathione S-transferase family protein n=1 Tax=Leptolyngbya sp. BC1307 TaxID=2029589 RepID=UPI000EFD19A9|nr:glutathione S-transferase family protein [Leptolyngbya sp. BC1307]